MTKIKKSKKAQDNRSLNRRSYISSKLKKAKKRTIVEIVINNESNTNDLLNSFTTTKTNDFLIEGEIQKLQYNIQKQNEIEINNNDLSYKTYIFSYNSPIIKNKNLGLNSCPPIKYEKKFDIFSNNREIKLDNNMTFFNVNYPLYACPCFEFIDYRNKNNNERNNNLNNNTNYNNNINIINDNNNANNNNINNNNINTIFNKIRDNNNTISIFNDNKNNNNTNNFFNDIRDDNNTNNIFNYIRDNNGSNSIFNDNRNNNNINSISNDNGNNNNINDILIDNRNNNNINNISIDNIENNDLLFPFESLYDNNDIDSFLFQNDNNNLPHNRDIKSIKENLSKTKIIRKSLLEDNQKNCMICLDEFKLGQNCYTLPCSHIFHVRCFNKELKIRKKCPICRGNL